MNIDTDLERIAAQERDLQFDRFDAADAWDLGCRLRAAAESRGVAVTVEIRMAGQTLFLSAMPGTTPANADWARRKRNVVELLGQSSYAVGLGLAREGTSLEDKQGLSLRDYATHGGSFPLRVAGVGCIGAITVSGLPQREDHSLIVAVLAERLGRPLAGLALDG
ncbi:heme-degrading domain-containing protein [Oscillochloris sp. ZM17-4]|uniref:heme-degrading domain-containing protein n=1 Tax=Oscillochloris sp. ZM17-4 TaxID=2866714 RepID=UPI001C73DAB4|nr:heme-degrading domain-containing protein [Oscillochloris sp. ZM17-4]MBX0329356.1 heme-degrading domain-containing protein [Oscillochloris sp. ZM17-4]